MCPVGWPASSFPGRAVMTPSSTLARCPASNFRGPTDAQAREWVRAAVLGRSVARGGMCRRLSAPGSGGRPIPPGRRPDRSAFPMPMEGSTLGPVSARRVRRSSDEQGLSTGRRAALSLGCALPFSSPSCPAAASLAAAVRAGALSPRRTPAFVSIPPATGTALCSPPVSSSARARWADPDPRSLRRFTSELR